MTIDDIERLVRRLERSDITAFEVSDATARLTLRLAPAAPGPASEPMRPAAEPPARVLAASQIGRFRAHHPDAARSGADRYPRVVAAGDVVAFLEAGPCLRPVVAAEDCTLGEPLRPDGSLVGYGTPLFRRL